MKKFLVAVVLAVFCSSISVFAQADSTKNNSHRRDTKWFVGIAGGFNMLTSENAASFFDTGHGGDLVHGHGFINAGYYFHPRIGVRLALEYSGNASAANYRESNKLFRPYTFSSLLGFADVVLNGGHVYIPKAFNWRFFAGVGAAGSFNYSQTVWNNPPYELNSLSKACFAFRYGLDLEYIWKSGIGLLFEISHEWMTDAYNGMDVKESFPFDTKFNCSLGLNYHF